MIYAKIFQRCKGCWSRVGCAVALKVWRESGGGRWFSTSCSCSYRRIHIIRQQNAGRHWAWCKQSVISVEMCLAGVGWPPGNTARQSKKAASAYFTSKQILPFGFAERNTAMDQLPAWKQTASQTIFVLVSNLNTRDHHQPMAGPRQPSESYSLENKSLWNLNSSDLKFMLDPNIYWIVVDV